MGERGQAEGTVCRRESRCESACNTLEMAEAGRSGEQQGPDYGGLMCNMALSGLWLFLQGKPEPLKGAEK